MISTAKQEMDIPGGELLRRMQEFDVDSLGRTEELGSQFCFEEVVPQARQLVELYKKLPLSALSELSSGSVLRIQKQIQHDLQIFNAVLEFNPEQERAGQTRRTLISQVANAYHAAFDGLHGYVAFARGIASEADLIESASIARAALEDANNRLDELIGMRDEAKTILQSIREAAGEHGVTQQAMYFHDEYEAHDGAADRWRIATVAVAIVVVLAAVGSLFLHKIPLLVPNSTFDAIQLGVSKMLVFAVLSYLLYLTARNFLSHKHNSIVNRHRYNALMTYRAIVAGASEAGRDVVLNHAAACVFSPQTTGYAGDTQAQEPGAKSVVELLMRGNES